ncbi:putative ribonuclease H-like domain-containing protein [Tanacetum coccineum]
MIVPSTTEEKIYVDAQSMFAAIKARFGGNEATKKTQKALLKQQYENFNASSSESLDSIFNACAGYDIGVDMHRKTFKQTWLSCILRSEFLEEFKQPREEENKKARKNNDAPIIKDWGSDDEDDVEPILRFEKKTVIPTATKKEFVKPKKPVRRSVREKGIKREYSVARTPQQNGVAERKNRTLIKAAKTMLGDSKLPTTFWAEAFPLLAIYRLMVLIVKPSNNTPYDLFRRKNQKKVSQALRDPALVEAMQEELLQFKLQNVWILVDLPKGHRAIGTKWMSKSAFPYGQIEEEVYVCQPPEFEDPDHPDKVYKVSPKSSHLLAIKRIFRYLKGKPSFGLWYSKDSPLELVAYTDSDYAGATQDRKSTTGVATSTTEAEYVSVASCLWTEFFGSKPTAVLWIGVLEDDLKTINQTYSSAFTKLILIVKKIEAQIKIRKVRRRARIVHSDDEDIADDSSKQGRKLSDVEVQEKASTASEVPIVSIAEVNLSTAGGTVTYTRRSKEQRKRKDKGKAIMTELEPKKKSKKEIEQERQWDEEERQRAISEAKSTKKIDWNDPSVIRPIFEKVWDFNQHIEPMEHGSENMKSPKKIEEKDADVQKEVKEVVKESGAKRKKSLP